MEVIKKKVKRILFGISGTDGLLIKGLMYGLLIGIGFVFLYPVLYLLANSFKSLDDLLNASVHWIPTTFYLGNYERAVSVLNFWQVLGQTLFVTVVPALLQTLAASFIGYGFARYELKEKSCCWP